MGIHAFIQDNLEKLGFATIAVGDPQGTWAYTVGFTDLGHPEFIISGLRSDYCHPMLWDLYRAVKGGKRYNDGDVDTEVGNLPVVYRSITAKAAAEFCCQGLYWYEGRGRAPQYLQMVLPDREGRFPWDAGFDHQLMRSQRQLWPERH